MPKGRDLFGGTGGGGGSGGSGGGSTRGRDLFGGAPSRRGGGGHAQHHGGGGFFHDLGTAAVNLGKGAEQAVIGLPNAVKTVGAAAGYDLAHPHFWVDPKKDPLYHDVLNPVAKTYAYKYGPLLRGHPGTTLHRALIEDPFGTILDIATVASLGAGAIGKVLPAEATALRTLPLRGPEALAKAGRITKPLNRVTVLENPVPAVIGGRAVHGTAFRARGIHAVLNKLPADLPVVGELRRFNRALTQLPRQEAARRRLLAIPLDKALRKLGAPERQATALIARWPLPRLLDAQVQKWEAIGDDVGALRIAKDPKVRALYEQPTPQMLNVLSEARRLGESDVQMLARYGKLTAEQAAAAPYLHMRVASGATFDGAELVGGSSIADLQAEAAAAGRPEPVYLHDTAVDRPTGGAAFEPRGGGTSPTPRSPVHQNQAILSSLGQLVLDPSTLVGQHLRGVKYALYRDTHATLESVAMRVPKGTKLPEGYEYLRRAVGPTGSQSERIGYAEKTAGEYHRQLEELLPTDEAQAQLGQQLTTLNPADAAAVENDRLIVPTSTVKALSGEFQRSSKAVRWIIERPLDVWRALLLNWSPRWLTNNIVGNTFMGLLRFGGPKYVKNWLAAVAEHSGPVALHHMLRDQETTSRLTAADIAELFPEQVLGTFKGSNMPFNASVASGKFRNLLREGLSPIDRGYEQALRRAAINTVAQKSPEVVRIYKQMPKQTREWRAATKKALADNPALAKKISQDVNSGVGDFTGLSAAERNWLRRLVPFYAWYRAITAVTLRLPLEIPVRVNLIAHLSQVRQEDQDLLNPDLPPWLRGAVSVGGNGILYTQGLNPYSTVPQAARGVGFLAQGGDYDAGQTALGMFNPAIRGFVASIPGRNEQSQGLPRNIWTNMYGNLPPLAALHLAQHGAPSSKTYVPSALDQLLSQLGVPLRHLQHPLVRR